VWSLPGMIRPVVAIKKVSFEAVAVTAAMDINGNMRAVYTCTKSVNVERFIKFLEIVV